ncbi:MAG TPA: hypothetical protein VMU84_11830, partial [Thermoanaerobaculia bacterium]|nr:hypothetical protein [Thermoanaerobaculia bacterium]
RHLIFGSLGGGLLFAIGLAYWWGIIDRVKERSRIRRAYEGQGLDDGERVAVVGTVVAQGPLLTSPLQQKPCVAYSYEIQRDGSQQAKYCDGFALTPSAIQTRSGLVRILAWPELAYDADYPFDEETKSRAVIFVESTNFTQFGGFRQALQELRNLRADADGAMRFDHQMTPWDPSQSAVFCERILAPGEEVCVSGRYSAMQQGFVPDPTEAVQSIKIQKGSAESVLKSGSSPFTYFILGLIFNGIAVAGLMILYRMVPAGAVH